MNQVLDDKELLLTLFWVTALKCTFYRCTLKYVLVKNKNWFVFKQRKKREKEKAIEKKRTGNVGGKKQRVAWS